MLNHCQFIGNLGNDPEARTMPNGDTAVNISVACSEKWKDKQTGESKEHTEWIRVSYFGRMADIIVQYLHKGSKVYVSGQMRTRKYTDSNGVEKYATDIKGRDVKFLDPAGSSNGGQQQAPQQNQQPAQQYQQPQQPQNFDDDIPF